MSKKIYTLEKFYNYLCDSTDSTWTGIVLEEGRHVFQDFCPEYSYAQQVKDVIDGVDNAEFIGRQGDMVLVVWKGE